MGYAQTTTDELGPIEVLYRAADTVLGTAERLIPQRALRDFLESVNWTEPFVLSLMASQIALLALTLSSRRNFSAQAAIFMIISATVFCAETLNVLGKKYWPHFASQDYFDRQGLFMMIFVCGPLILTANIVVVRSFTHSFCCLYPV